MRQLLPEPAEVDPADAHARAERPAPAGRPWLLANMVVSLDGATAVAGRSGALGSAGDKAVFSALRAVADVIVVGAATVRAEGYGPPRTPQARRAERLARGQEPFPRIVVVSRSLDLDPTSSMFTEAHEPPLVYTVATAPESKVAALAPVAEVVAAGEDSVDVTAMLADLGRRGVTVALTEGGPVLNGHFLAAGLVDELDLTTAPLLVGGDSDRVTAGAPIATEAFDLAHLWEDDGFLLARYVRRGTRP